MLCAASTHDEAELAQAAKLGVDFAVLGPVLPRRRRIRTRVRSAGGVSSELAAGSPMPVYALGGLASADLDVAIAHGAHGVALRRAAWPALPLS